MTVDDGFEGFGDVGDGVYVAKLASRDDGDQQRPILCPAVMACKESIFSGQTERPDSVLDWIGVKLQAAVIEEAGKALPVCEPVTDILGQCGGRGDHRQLLLEPRLQRRDDRCRMLFSSGEPDVRRHAAHILLNGVERGDLTNRLLGDRRLCRAREFYESPPQVAPTMNKYPWSLRSLNAGESAITVIAVALQELSVVSLQEALGICATAPCA